MTTEHAKPVQRELALPAPELSGDLPLLPARVVNEYQYCPHARVPRMGAGRMGGVQRYRRRAFPAPAGR
jgi:hypothetical protein